MESPINLDCSNAVFYFNESLSSISLPLSELL